MSPRAAHAAAALAGVVAMALGGQAAGGWWWPAALVGAGAAVAGRSERHAGSVQALATLVLTAGVVAAQQERIAVVLAAGLLVSLELAAGADRATRVRPRALAPAPGRLLLALAPAPAVLLVAGLTPGPAVPLTLLAVVAGSTVLVVSSLSPRPGSPRPTVRSPRR